MIEASGKSAKPARAVRRSPLVVALLALGFVVLLGALAAGVFLATGGNWRFGAGGPAGPTDTVKVLISADGIVALPLADLQAAGLSRGGQALQALDPSALRLTLKGADVPFFVSGDRLVFYGLAPRMPDSLYTGENVYWLQAGRGAGVVMAERPAAPVSGGTPERAGLIALHVEENKVFQAMAPEGVDPWVWAQIVAGASVTNTFTAPDATGDAATLAVSVLSVTDTAQKPDHHLVVRLNGAIVGEDRWDGIVRRVFTMTVPAGLLRAGDNQISVSAPGDTGAAAEVNFLDAFDLEYPRPLALGDGTLAWTPISTGGAHELSGQDGTLAVLDVSDPAHPVRLTGASLTFADKPPAGSGLRYAAGLLERIGPGQVVAASAPTLEERTAGADYLVIAPPEFAEAVKPLIEWRRQQGLKADFVSVADVFDAYGAGLPTPDAVRAFLRATQTQWAPRPRYVLLVGDASYDYRGYTRGPNPSLVPTYLVSTSNSGQTASDVWYTQTGEGRLPQFALGRLPADDPDQASVLVGKIIAYESAPREDWTRRVLLAADSEAEFRDVSDSLAAKVFTDGIQVQKVYFGGDLTAEQAHEQIMAALNGGLAVANYIGHGSMDVWGDEKALRSADAAELSNGDRLPILVTYTCLNGFFHHPEATSLAEVMLWKRGGGIVAAVVPSGRTYTLFQRALIDAFYTALYSPPSADARLGDALLQAQRGLSPGGGYDEVLLTFNLLGDPALRFAGAPRQSPLP